MKFVVTLSFVLLLPPGLWAQKIARTKALQDLTFLNQAVVNGHPVNYNPARRPVTLLPLIQKLNAAHQDSLTPTEFRLLLNEAIFTIGCVHTRIASSPPTARKLDPVFLPTAVFIRNGTLVDTLNRQIQSINGVAAQQLVKQFSCGYASDGTTTALATAVFNKNSCRLVSQYLNYPAQYTIRLDTTSLLLNAGKSIPTQPVAPSPDEATVLVKNADNVFYRTPTVPVLKLTQFAKTDRALLKQTFRYLARAQARNLILDLRGNLGGHRNTAVLLTQHLLNKSFSYIMLQPRLATRQYVTSQGKLYLFLAKLKYNVGNCFLGRQTALGRAFVYHYKPKKNHFEGQVYVLTDGYTASASTMVTSWLKQHSSALFIGQQSGGGYNGNNGGSFPRVKLPDTQYEIIFPAYRLLLDSHSGQFQGIIPDVVVEPSLYQDNTLRQTIALIGSKS